MQNSTDIEIMIALQEANKLHKESNRNIKAIIDRIDKNDTLVDKLLTTINRLVDKYENV